MYDEDREKADEPSADKKLQEETLQSEPLCVDLDEDEPGWEETPKTASFGSPQEPPSAPLPETFTGPEGLPTAKATPLLEPPEVPPPSAATLVNTAEETAKRPISPEKLAANRANAQHSTGPKTAEGKAKSRFNAVKYGLTSRYFPTLLQENSAWAQTYQDLRRNLYVHFAPEGPIEEMLVDKIVVETIRYSRLLSHEQQPDILKTHAYWEVLRLCTRYQSAINRQLFEAMQELERLQAKRIAEHGNAREGVGSDDPET